jgi:hypothetical protein
MQENHWLKPVPPGIRKLVAELMKRFRAMLPALELLNEPLATLRLAKVGR